MLKAILTKTMEPSGPEEEEVEADAADLGEQSVGSNSPIQRTGIDPFQTLRKKSSMINELDGGGMRYELLFPMQTHL